MKMLKPFPLAKILFRFIAVLLVAASVKAASAAVLTVTTANDSGAGSLRQMIAASASGGTIAFANALSGATILLTSGELMVTNNITIDASALSAGILINGNANGRIFEVTAGATVVFDSLTITNGFAGNGGGIFNSGTLAVNRCTLAGNTANFYGGGIENNGTLTVNQCTLTANSCGNAGGGGIDNNNGGMFVVNQSTLTGNNSDHNAGSGGIYLYDGSGTLNNSIVAGNTALTYSNLFGAIAATGVNLTNGVPLLTTLGNYGGPTPTMVPLTNSPAINACTGGTSFITDQRGLPRVVGPFADIGAVEYQGPATVVTAPFVLTDPGMLGGGSFRFAFTNISGMSFTVHASTNATLPLNMWSNLGPALETPAASGQFQFNDPLAANYGTRFYRVTSP